MTLQTAYFTLLATLGTAAPLLAGTGGQNEGLLIRALLANAEGNCPAELMGAGIKADCERQLPQFRATLTRLGPIKSTRFQGVRTLETGSAEVYQVAFQHGEMVWLINTQDDGRIQVLWAPNEPH